MKQILLVLIAAGSLTAQFERSTVELSMTGSGGMSSVKGSGVTVSSESQFYLFTTASVEYYIAGGIAIGPQYGLLAVDDQPPSHSLVMNLSFTQSVAESPVALFAKMGYGKGNAISVPLSGGVIPSRVSEQWDVGIWTVGGGVKFFVSEAALLRVEMNYRNESYTDDNALVALGPPSYQYQYRTVELEYRIIGMLFGCSVLL